MKVLVTGGTGFIGKPLVRDLAEKGHKVVLFARTDDIDRPDKAIMITGDILNKRALRKAFMFADVVYHLAACMDEDDPKMQDINVKGTENVVELCREKGVKHLVFMSTAGVLGETHAPTKEHAPHDPKTKYDKSKADAEKLVRDSGIPYTIVRAPAVIGPSADWYRIFAAIRNGHPIVGTGKNKLHLVHVDDVVRMLDTVLNNKRAFNHVFHVATKDLMTQAEVYDLICKHMNVRNKKRYGSLRMTKLFSRAKEIKGLIDANAAPGITVRHINMLSKSHALSIQKAKDLLNFEPNYTTPEAIYETIRGM